MKQLLALYFISVPEGISMTTYLVAGMK